MLSKPHVAIPRAQYEALMAAKEALAFYADWQTYFAIGFFPDRPCGAFMDDFSEVEDDLSAFATRPGRRAREALAALRSAGIQIEEETK